MHATYLCLDETYGTAVRSVEREHQVKYVRISTDESLFKTPFFS